MLKGLQLSHHRHSGKLQPHKYTSYVPLLILLALTAIPLSAYTSFALSPGPESQSISLSGTVAGKPPTVAATIVTPSNQQHFGTSPITVSGTCPAGTLVEIYKSDIFGGSTVCSDKGKYEFQVDLLIGANILKARVYDALNQAGPDSNEVTVYYDLLPAQSAGISSIDFGGPQIVLSTDAVFRGTFPGQELSMPLTLVGGVAPYAFNIQWGDSKNNVMVKNSNASFLTSHTFQKAGTYQMSIQVTDSQSRVAFLSVAAIVNGQAEAINGTSLSTTSKSALASVLALWPLYVSLIAVVLSFWFGEMREKKVMGKTYSI